MSDITIRPVIPEDAADILAIYSYYVEKTAITFELEVPSLSEFQARIAKTLTKYPYLAAVRDGHIVGYAYAGTFKDRAAYDHSVELTIYLSPGERGHVRPQVWPLVQYDLDGKNHWPAYLSFNF